ncbi:MULTISPECIES: TniB family NTP-binding protein [unclassified Paenibacillus]|uniref:TniB family NTP-binding protein n=1 Tax=unclassified Paenibacillus TaxID=185978 RepID=UPI0007BEDBC4|nr:MULTISPECIES: TniB family NTP-binding protein [unclassified Paenibacillus]SEB26015.1 AAA domain-containing protein [Paenibacillus sp. 276b]
MIVDKFERLNGAPASRVEHKRRKEHVKKIIVHHPQYNEVLEQLEDMLYMSDGSVSPDQLFIFGPTGVGKSTVTTEFKDRYPPVEVFTSDKHYTRIPVLHVRVPPKASPKALASKLLNQMGDPFFNVGTEVQMTSRIHHFIRELEIKMIILDEFQHLIDSDRDSVLATAANWVKTFSEESSIPVVLCGMPNSINIFAKEKQLDRRYATKLSLKGFEYFTAEDKVMFRAFLDKVEQELPFADKSNLSNIRLADKLFYISMGIPFYVMKLLEFATEVASKKGEDSIHESHLEQALKKIGQVSRPFRVNPFNQDNFDLIDELSRETKKEGNSKTSQFAEKQNNRKK